MNKLFMLAPAALMLLAATRVLAQGTSINTTGAAADHSAMLDVNATNKGILIPRLTSAQIGTIISPATGLLVYQVGGATPGFYYYNGSAWKSVSAAFNDTLTQNLYTNGFLLSGDDTTGILIGSNGQLIDTGTTGGGSDLAVAGAGTRLIWYPKLGAFRAGSVDANEWDLSQIGLYSTATGYGTNANGQAATAMGSNTIAGDYSTAMGLSTTATGGSTAMGLYTQAAGNASTAMGYETIANGYYNTAMGFYTTASGFYNTAMGFQTTASGNSSTGMGAFTVASGDYSISMGESTTASGFNSTAMGAGTIASGDYSTAMGVSVSTDNYPGAFIIGDSYQPYGPGYATYSTAADQMTMRFANGYTLYTADDASAGVAVSAGGGSWSSVSDRRKKTNFTTLDKEDMLMKVCAMPVTRWNYKSQPAAQKHVGPMAQDFYAAFQLDGVGNDTTINTTDIDGVNMIAIQALEKRTEELKKENDALKALLTKQQLSFDERMNKVEAMLTKKEENGKLSVK